MTENEKQEIKLDYYKKEVTVMNIGSAVKQLQKALLIKGMQIKINTQQIYIEEDKKMVTLYVVTTPKPRRNKEGELYMKDESIYETYSKAQLIKFLYRIYKEGGVPVGKIN